MKNMVSVIVNCHNGEKYLEDCLKSILNQNYDNFEIILWDNASTDKSKNVIEKFQDKRIKYFKNSIKENLYKARNRAVNVSSGQFIAFLDCDDWWEKNYLSSREKLFSNRDIDFYYCNTNLYYEKKKKKKLYRNISLPGGKIFSDLSKDYFIIISGVIFKRDLFTRFGFFNENYNIIGDYDFVMKISKQCNAHYTDLPLLNYRVHDSNFLKLNSELFYNEYKDWYEKVKRENNFNFKKYQNFFINKLSYLELIFLLENKKKSISTFNKILSHKVFMEKIKLLILFLLPRNFFKYLKK